MSAAERQLTEHRGAVRASLPNDANHAAATARRPLDVARYSRTGAPVDVRAAVDALERQAVAVQRRVAKEHLERQQAGLDLATYQRHLEEEQPGRRSSPAPDFRPPAASGPPGPVLPGGRRASGRGPPCPAAPACRSVVAPTAPTIAGACHRTATGWRRGRICSATIVRPVTRQQCSRGPMSRSASSPAGCAGRAAPV